MSVKKKGKLLVLTSTQQQTRVVVWGQEEWEKLLNCVYRDVLQVQNEKERKGKVKNRIYEVQLRKFISRKRD